MSSIENAAREAIGGLMTLRDALQGYFDRNERSIPNPEHHDLLAAINDLDTAIEAAALQQVVARIGAGAEADLKSVAAVTTELKSALDRLDASLEHARLAIKAATADVKLITAVTASPFSLAAVQSALASVRGR